MSAEVLPFEKRRRRSSIGGHRLSAILAIAFIVTYLAIALSTLFLGWPAALLATTDLYPGL